MLKRFPGRGGGGQFCGDRWDEREPGETGGREASRHKIKRQILIDSCGKCKEGRKEGKEEMGGGGGRERERRKGEEIPGQ